VNEDVVEALKWYRRAAEEHLVEAIAELGECLLEGTGVTLDIEEGVSWIRKAAERGYAPAQRRLGLCYVKGEGVAKDFVQAYMWFDLAAAQGGPEAADTKVDLAKVASRMSPEQIAGGQRLAREFKKRTVEDASSETSQNLSEGTGVSPTNAPLGAKDQGGVVSVSAQESAEVYVDGSFVGNPPAKLHLPEGSHVIEVKNQGFKDYRKEIKVSKGAELNLRVTLEKQ